MGIVGVIVLIGIGIGLYFVITHKNSSTGITPAGVDDFVDAEWVFATSLDGDVQKSIICDGRTNDGGIVCHNQEDCLDIASADWRDLIIQFVTYENTGYGEDGKYGQCTGSNFSTDTKYKMISIGSCETMGANNIDTEGHQWEDIDTKEKCNESIEYLSDNNLIIPGGSWYETALNNSSDPEGPIQIYKNEDGKTERRFCRRTLNATQAAVIPRYVGLKYDGPIKKLLMTVVTLDLTLTLMENLLNLSGAPLQEKPGFL